MTLYEFNQLERNSAHEMLATTCGSSNWQSLIMTRFPFVSEAELVKTAGEVWYYGCSRQDWLEAFSHHPKIGDINSLAERFPTTKHLAGSEQSGVNTASQEIIEQLAKANELYEAKFGFIFIVFATGKTATEMLRILIDRSSNNYEEELIIAMGEQLKITINRFKKVIENADWHLVNGSQLTSHVLDTSLGKPGKNMTVRLKHFVNNTWYTLAQGVTNADGRVGDLLPPEKYVLPGNYKMVFETFNYFRANNVKGFYPEVEVFFTVSDEAHYHVPLLINPYGYSTYRGS
jgi:5-hydroxyisourate hydrolase / 2-oxo-4-hydroxy-4-carboxy-5-ureidoimidazoline decarboxylase